MDNISQQEQAGQNHDIQRVGELHADGVVAFVRPEWTYCPRCATGLQNRTSVDSDAVYPTCPACGYVAYTNPAPAVGAVILNGDDEVLLVRRKFEPNKGGWSLPAGFMEFGERQVDSLAREVLEETRLTMTSASLLCVEDGSEDPRTHALLIAFLVHEWSGEPVPGDDADAVGWFHMGQLPQNMAWRSHTRVLKRVQRDIDGYTTGTGQ
jgi:8-oxo-dGTP diphosphatase